MRRDRPAALFIVVVVLALGVYSLGMIEPPPQEDEALSTVGPGAEQSDVASTGSLGPLELEKVDNHPLYILRLEGNYGFTEYLRTGHLNYSFSDGSGHSCTCFAAIGEGSDPLFGRNFDFPENPALLLYTDPPDGYASVSMVDLGYFGYGMDRLPDPEGDLEDLRMTPFLPFDGMNEHGLAVGMAAIPHAEPPHDPGKGTIGEIQVIRLLLDRARDVDEALMLLGEYNVAMTDPHIHYIIADRSGRSAIVEFVDGEMVVLRDDEPWQVITNFIVNDSGAPDIAPCSRYRSAYGGLREAGGAVSMEEAMDLLEGSSQQSTIWSTVYNLETGELRVAMGRSYERVHSLRATLAED